MKSCILLNNRANVAMSVLALAAFSLFADVVNLRSEDYGYSAVIEVPDVRIRENGNGYSVVTLPGYCRYQNDAGKPALPRYECNLAIGSRQMPPVITAKVLEEQEVAVGRPVVPFQRSTKTTRQFCGDDKYLRGKGVKEPLVAVSQPFTAYGIPGVSIVISPVSYNPLLNRLSVARKIMLRIEMPEGIDAIPLSPSRIKSGVCKQFYINYSDRMQIKGLGKRAGGYDEKDNYLIIVAGEYKDHDALNNEFIPFRQNLYNVEKVTVADAGGQSTSGVKSFLADYYNNNGLTFVLFIGDKNSLPYFTHSEGSSNNASFWDYELLDGNDQKSDIAVGVFCVGSTAELNNIIQKTIHTEQNIDNYPEHTLMYSTYSSGEPGSPEHVIAQDGFVRRNSWDKVPGWSVDWQIPEPNSGDNPTSNVIAALNNNEMRVLTYQGHGYESGFAEGITSGHVSSFTNSSVFPFVWAYSCLTGTFQGSQKCFGQVITTSPNGACSYVGASDYSGMGQKILHYGMAKAFALLDDITTMGFILSYGKLMNLDSIPAIPGEDDTSQTLWVSDDDRLGTAQKYNLFGDPALETMHYSETVGTAHTQAHASAAPASPDISVSGNAFHIDIPDEEYYTAAIYSASGKRIVTLFARRHLVSGRHRITWNISGLAEGYYVLQLSSAGMKCRVGFIKSN